jgi:hypothetical protein
MFVHIFASVFEQARERESEQRVIKKIRMDAEEIGQSAYGTQLARHSSPQTLLLTLLV